jgi:hypothetical protein
MYGEIAEIVGVERVDMMILEDDEFVFPSSVDEIREIQENNEVSALKTTIEEDAAEDIVYELAEGGHEAIHKETTSSSLVASF